MDLKEAQSLASWLNWLEIGSCTCPFAWQQLGRLYGISMGPGWVRLKDTPGCPVHDSCHGWTAERRAGRPSWSNPWCPIHQTRNCPEGAEMPIAKLCTATYDEPHLKDKSDTHTCDIEEGHSGPHHCDTCGSWWRVRVGVVKDPGPDREQIALARMDAHLVGNGYVMITRTEDGSYEYDRVDPIRVTLLPPEAAEVDLDVESAIRRAARRSIASLKLREKLELLVRRGDLRRDDKRGWVSVKQLNELLEGLDGGTTNGVKKK